MNEQTQPTNEAPEVQCQSGWLSPDLAEQLRSELVRSFMEWQKVRTQAWGLCDAIRNDMVPTVVCTLADMLLRELEQREPNPEIVEMAKNWEAVGAKAKSDELEFLRSEHAAQVTENARLRGLLRKAESAFCGVDKGDIDAVRMVENYVIGLARERFASANSNVCTWCRGVARLHGVVCFHCDGTGVDPWSDCRVFGEETSEPIVGQTENGQKGGV